MADPALKVGPQNIDNSAQLTRRAGVGNHALRLLRRHARNNPPELVADLSKPRDERRSRVAEDNLERIAETLKLPKGAQVEGASVKGAPDGRSGDRVVTLVLRYPPTNPDAPPNAGRSGKASVEWEKLPWLEDEYEKRERARLGLAARAAALDPDNVDDSAPLSADDAEELRKRLAAAEEALAAAAKAAEEEPEPEPEPEPFEGYSDATVEDIEKRIAEEPEGFDRELLKREIRAAEEERDRPRAGVIAATEPVELVPAAATEG